MASPLPSPRTLAEPEAVARAVELTAGQPWLVNALAREIVKKLAVPVAQHTGPRQGQDGR
jgi:hypothetical protein